jgi:hypothetical protein
MTWLQLAYDFSCKGASPSPCVCASRDRNDASALCVVESARWCNPSWSFPMLSLFKDILLCYVKANQHRQDIIAISTTQTIYPSLSASVQDEAQNACVVVRVKDAGHACFMSWQSDGIFSLASS